MKTIIIEDEKPAARHLKRMLDKQDVDVVEMLHSVEEAINWFSENEHPDLIFLDIQLSDGLSFEIFDSVPIKSAIVFTTAYDEYALKAFKLNSIDYLLKPIAEVELSTAIEKYRNLQKPTNSVQMDFEEIKKLLINPIEHEYKKRFTTQIGHQIKLIPVDEIEYFFSENKGTYAATFSKRNYLLEQSLESLENELSPKEFFRVNRQFIINIHGIKEIVTYSNSRLKVVLKNYNEQDIIVARERVKDFKLWLE